MKETGAVNSKTPKTKTFDRIIDGSEEVRSNELQ
jgi:hypothetical protein